jgi:hypothetical protein
MRKFTFASSSLLIIAALSAHAFAQTAATTTPSSPTPEMNDSKIVMKEGQMLMVMPNGEIQTMQADANTKAMMLKDGKPMSGNMLMMMQGGKTMTMEDKKMPDGKTMGEQMMMKKMMMK